MSLVLVGLYLFLFFLNLVQVINKKRNKGIIFFTFILLLFLMSFKQNVLPVNGVYLDHHYYELDYNNFSFDSVRADFKNYYLFYIFEYIGHYLGLSYMAWSGCMTLLSLLLIYKAIKRFNYDEHVFLLFFMFFVIALYASLKQYYGFCLLIYAFSYLSEKSKYSKLRFLLFLILASGFHLMFYLFIIFVFVDTKFINFKYLFIFIFIIMLGIIVFNRSGFIHQLTVLAGRLLRNNSRQVYFEEATNNGFIIPMTLHLASLFYCKIYRKAAEKSLNSELISKAEFLYRVNLLCIVYYPLFLIAVTFTRIIMNITLINFLISSQGYNRIGRLSKQRVILSSFIVVFLFSLYFYGPLNFYEYALVPFFTIYLW